MRSLGAFRSLLPSHGFLRRRFCSSNSYDSINSLRQLLHQQQEATDSGLRDYGWATAGRTSSSGHIPSSPRSLNPSHVIPAALEGVSQGNVVAAASSGIGSSGAVPLIKELLRIFTRKVPGGLVPDSLVRGFMQAYGELQGPAERLAFFRLIISEMGLSASEVASAVRLWNAALARAASATASATAASAAPPTAPSAPPGEAPVPPSSSSPSSSASSSPACQAASTAAASLPAPPASATTASATPEAPAPPSAPAAAAEGAFHDALYRAADRLSSACQPLYTQLFLPISQAPQGMKFLVDMRADLLALAAERAGEAPADAAPLRAMADHLRQSLAEWFSVGLLHLQPISWQDSPAALLERVMAAEAVHPLSGWEELRRRLGPRRRVFAFTHPCMPGEPLVVLHTALLDRPAASMGEILDRSGDGHASRSQRPPQPSASGSASAGLALTPHPPPSPPPPPPRTAVFYSISNSQPGLRGIELGHFLIKRVAELLRAEHPTIQQLVTLSPLPNFRSWLTSRLQQDRRQDQPQQPGPGQQAKRELETPAPPPAAALPAVAPPLLRPPEAEAAVRLALSLGWRRCGGPGGSSGEPTAVALSSPTRPSFPTGAATAASALPTSSSAAAASPQASAAEAAAAMSWLLEGDRWLGGGGGGAAAEGTVAAAAAAGGEVQSDVRVGGDAGGEATAAAAMATGGEAAGGGGGVEGPAAALLRPLLLRLAARYLAVEKRRRFALCPVAHFHLRNGARLWRLNWGADTSPLGLRRSFGIMVNYEYDLASVYENNERYLLRHEVRAHTRVLELLGQEPQAEEEGRGEGPGQGV